VDSSGNVYATGYAKESSSGSLDYVTLKFDRNGNRLWRAVYDSGASEDDKPVALAIDPSGNVYVTGSSQADSGNGGWDYATIKYDSNGNRLWASRYNGSNNKDDLAAGMAVDKNGNVFVTGSSKNALSQYQFATVKYDSQGNRVWVKTYGSGLEDDAVSLTMDSSGNIYVTGKSRTLLSGLDITTIKYSNAGDQLWAKSYSGDLLKDDVPPKVVVDSSGFVYVLANVQALLLGSIDFAVIKYDNNGQKLWLATYNGPSSRADYPSDMTVDQNGNVYVTGASNGTDGKSDFATVKFNSNGAQVWVARYQGASGGDDKPLAIALDPSGNVYVTGESEFSSTGFDVLTMKYSGATGAEKWTARYNSSGNINDVGISLSVQDDNTVIVGAQANNNLDYTLIKYQSRVFFPKISSALHNVTVGVGEPAVFNVTATGDGPLGYQWSKNGIAISGATNSALEFNPAKLDDTGNYSVTVSNDFGADTSASAMLNVTNAPVILAAPKFEVSQNGAFSFSASVPQGVTCIVLASSDFIHWTPIATNTTPSLGIVINDPESTNRDHRFYRLLLR
jgi:outer membrane protein assembly factor BamB